MGIMDTLASVSAPEPESGGIAANMAQATMQYAAGIMAAGEVWGVMASQRWGCLAFQIVSSFDALLAVERAAPADAITCDAAGHSDQLFDVIARQAAPDQNGVSVRRWSRGYPQGDGRWVKLSDGSAIHWQFSHDAQQRSRQSAVMSAFLWHRDVQDQNVRPLTSLAMPGVGLLAIEQVMAQAIADLTN